MCPIFVASFTKGHSLGKHLASRGYEKRIEAEVQRGGGVNYSTVASSKCLDRFSWPLDFKAFDSAFLPELGGLRFGLVGPWSYSLALREL
jgi:hypothetical protein